MSNYKTVRDCKICKGNTEHTMLDNTPKGYDYTKVCLVCYTATGLDTKLSKSEAKRIGEQVRANEERDHYLEAATERDEAHEEFRKAMVEFDMVLTKFNKARFRYDRANSKYIEAIERIEGDNTNKELERGEE